MKVKITSGFYEGEYKNPFIIELNKFSFRKLKTPIKIIKLNKEIFIIQWKSLFGKVDIRPYKGETKN